MRQFIAMIALMLAGLVHLAGCSGPDKPTWLSLNPNDWANRSEKDDPVLLDVAGPVAVDVVSFNGDVIIESNPKLKQGKVTVVRAAVHGETRAAEADSSLADIHYSVEIVPGELGQALRIITSTTSSEPHFQRAHIYIQLPEIEGVAVHTSNGKVDARNIRGDVDIATTQDDVRLLTNQPMTKSVTIINRNGNIDYRVRGESTGLMDAQTVNGRVSSIVRYGTMIIQPPTTGQTLHGILNEGANRITLRTVNGDIRIAVVSNPEQFGDLTIN